MSSSSSLQPLQSTLDTILARLSFLESKAGIDASSIPVAAAASTVASTGVTTTSTSEEEEIPRLVAYDEHITKALLPFVNACNSIDGLKNTGPNIQKIWNELKTIITIGTKCKKPSSPSDLQSSLMPFLQPVQDAMADIRKARLDRKFDWHIKAIMEMLACVSWVIMTAPPAPSTFIKDTVGSSDFWSNKIRKEYKGKDGGENMIAFCDTLKALILDLASYVKEYHLSGLMWNPKGIPIADYKASSSSSSTTSTPAATSTTNTTTVKKAAGSSIGGGADIMKELAKKRTGDGDSAATGLKKVSRDQQTWRKEFKKDTTPIPTVKPSQIKATQSKKTTVVAAAKEPVCKFQSLGSKWIIEYQTKTSNPNGVCTVEIKDPKEQVYIYKCEGATIQLKGKLKSVILDSCKKTNIIFDTAISSCEVVNSKSVQIQATGICPSFAIDKTDGCLVYLSEAAVSVTSFVTSKSTEMNVSWPDEKSGEQKEAPIPEQFVHRLMNGSVTSEVSDLYH